MNRQNTVSPIGHMDEEFFAHPLEKRVAVILDEKLIRYTYRVPVDVVIDGKVKHTEIDFVLFCPILVKGYGWVKNIEVKNRMSKSAEDQHILLKDNGYVTLVVTAEMVEVFEREGFLEEEK